LPRGFAPLNDPFFFAASSSAAIRIGAASHPSIASSFGAPSSGRDDCARWSTLGSGPPLGLRFEKTPRMGTALSL